MRIKAFFMLPAFFKHTMHLTFLYKTRPSNGQPTIRRPFYGQAKGQLRLTCAFYAECAHEGSEGSEGSKGSEGGSGGFGADYSGWRRGLGRRFARFALRAMSIKNYPHRFAKLVSWERHLCHPGRIGQPEADRPAFYFLSFSSPSSSGFQPPPNALKRDTMSVSSFPLDRV